MMYGYLFRSPKCVFLKKESEKEGLTNFGDVGVDILGIAPPIQAKIRRFQQAGKTIDYNKKEIDFLKQNTHANSIFVDIGANIGFYTQNIASTFKKSNFSKIFLLVSF